MRYYLDTEFNGFGGSLISMALVPEIGSGYLYLARECRNPTLWVRGNVLPVLQRAPFPEIVDGPFATRITEYLGADKRPEIIADWPEDLSHFLLELVTKPGYCVSLAPTLKLLQRSDLPEVSIAGAAPHHALWDAMTLREQHRLMLAR